MKGHESVGKCQRGPYGSALIEGNDIDLAEGVNRRVPWQAPIYKR